MVAKCFLFDLPAEGLEGFRRTVGSFDLLRGLLIRFVAHLVVGLDFLHARRVPQEFCAEKNCVFRCRIKSDKIQKGAAVRVDFARRRISGRSRRARDLVRFNL